MNDRGSKVDKILNTMFLDADTDDIMNTAMDFGYDDYDNEEDDVVGGRLIQKIKKKTQPKEIKPLTHRRRIRLEEE